MKIVEADIRKRVLFCKDAYEGENRIRLELAVDEM